MAASTPTYEHLGGGNWRASWAGTAPFRLYHNGTQVATQDGGTTERTEYVVVTTDAVEPPALEVFDSTESDDVAQTITYCPRGTLQWRRVVAASYYTIEKYDGADWDIVGRAYEDGLIGYHQFTTQTTPTGTEVQYRITAYDARGGTSDTRTFTWTPIAIPAPPAITLSYSSGTGNVTVSAA